MYYTFFKRSALWLTIAVIFVSLVTLYLSRPETVVLDSNHWECDVAVVDGLHTKCTVYSVKGV